MIGLILAGVLVAQAPCAQQTSIFGTVVETNANEITVHTSESRMGDIHVYTRGARVNSNGLVLQNGVYVGVYGCLAPNNSSFRAEEVTLARDANSYNGYHRRATVITGRIDQVETNRFLVDSNNGHGDVWIYSVRRDLRTGELVRVTGTFDPRQSAFVASTVDIQRY
jgi:hypothetical protein